MGDHEGTTMPFRIIASYGKLPPSVLCSNEPDENDLALYIAWLKQEIVLAETMLDNLIAERKREKAVTQPVK